MRDGNPPVVRVGAILRKLLAIFRRHEDGRANRSQVGILFRRGNYRVSSCVFREKLNGDVTSRHIDFSYTTDDFRHARILHVFEGGGWRRLAGSLATFAISAFGVYVIWDYLTPHRNPAVLCGLTGALLGVPLLRARRKLRKHYFGPQRIYFGEQGLHLQDSGTLARNSWTQFIGYLEDGHVFLLHYTPRTYRIIPRRALIGCEAAFRALLEVKVRRFNDKRPLPPPVREPARQSQRTS